MPHFRTFANIFGYEVCRPSNIGSLKQMADAIF